MKCNNCGYENQNGNNFCMNCGSKLIYNNINELNTNFNSNNMSEKKTQKKLMWWLPLILFLIGLIPTILKVMIYLVVPKENIKQCESIVGIFSILGYLCWFLVFPSLILILVLYFTNNKKDKI